MTSGATPAPVGRRRGRPRRAESAAGGPGTRERILAAARAEFAERGYDAASIRGIARVAEVDQALVHHYFGTKEQVFGAAVAAAAAPATDTLSLRAAAAGLVDGVVALAPASVAIARWLRDVTTSPMTARLSRIPVPPWVLRTTLGYGYSRLIAGVPGSPARRAGRRFSSGYDHRSAAAASTPELSICSATR